MLNNFIYAKTKDLFTALLDAGNVLDEAIVFIEDTKEIWNHGTYFDGSKVDLSDVEKSIQDILDDKVMWVKVEGEAGVRLKGTNGIATGNLAISAGDDKTASDGTLFTSKASGDHAVAFGYGNTCAGRTTLAQGLYNTVNGKDSVAFGQRNLVSGDQAFAAGQQNEVTSRLGVTIGYKNKATNIDSIALGYQNTSSGSGSVAMGDTCEATGTSSTAMGYKTKAIGAHSATFGKNTQATNEGEVSMGIYNKSTTSTDASELTMFSFGIGTSDTKRSNAIEIKKNGDVYIGDKLLTDEYITKDNATATYLPIGDYATKTEIPTKVSQLKNDSNYILDDVISDGVYAVNANGKLIDYNTADSSCLGVALIAGEHKFMIAKSDATNDGSNYNLYWTNNTSDLSLTNYTKSDGTNGSGYLPKPDGSYQSTPNLSGDFTTWTAGALSDFNGKANTAVIAAASSHAKDMCTVLNTFNQTEQTAGRSADWYVPACGQLALMYLNMTEINAALAKIGGTAIAGEFFWSSSEYSSNYAWGVYFNDGVVSGNRKDDDYRVRFIRDLTTIKKPLKEKVSEIESSVSDLKLNYFKWSKLILPSFTIAGVSYDFEEGMTWEEWVNSEYNTDGALVFRDDSGKIQAIYGGPYTSIVFNGSESESESEMVLPADIIISGHNYIAYDPAVE